MQVQCFGCGQFFRLGDCELRKHRISGIRRWFHKEEVKAGCLCDWHKRENWELVDSSLGETTHEEIMSIGNVMLHLDENKN